MLEKSLGLNDVFKEPFIAIDWLHSKSVFMLRFNSKYAVANANKKDMVLDIPNFQINQKAY